MKEPDRGEWTSASAAQADGLCPARHLRQKPLPRDESGRYARFGSVVHAALAKNDPAGLDAGQADIYESCLDIERKLLVQFFGPEVEGKVAKPVTEQRLWAEWRTGDGKQTLKHSGQLDRYHRKGGDALIIEFKSLAGDVPDSVINQQLRDQAVLLWKNSVMLNRIGVAVVQPLVTHQPSICVYTPDDLRQAGSELLARVIASNTPDQRAVPGTVQCQFCRAKTVCKEYNQWVTTSLPALRPFPKPLIEIPAAKWTAEQRVLFCEALDDIGRAMKWVDECKAYLKQLLTQDPEAVPGWKLKPGSMDTSVSDPQEYFNRFIKLGGSPAEPEKQEQLTRDFMECIEVVRTKVKNKVRAMTDTKGRALDAIMDALLKGIAETKQRSPTLVRTKDDA